MGIVAEGSGVFGTLQLVLSPATGDHPQCLRLRLHNLVAVSVRLADCVCPSRIYSDVESRSKIRKGAEATTVKFMGTRSEIAARFGCGKQPICFLPIPMTRCQCCVSPYVLPTKSSQAKRLVMKGSNWVHNATSEARIRWLVCRDAALQQKTLSYTRVVEEAHEASTEKE
jgi:hypothetical protein